MSELPSLNPGCAQLKVDYIYRRFKKTFIYVIIVNGSDVYTVTRGTSS